jgi:hypothetical protein
MIIVVPPASPAAVPDRKSSCDTVPMKGISMCVCGSMPPGITRAPPASTTSTPTGASSPSPTALITPASQSTSALNDRSALTTVPPRISRAMPDLPLPCVAVTIGEGARRLPDPADAVGVEECLVRDQGQVLEQRLGDEYAVERVLVASREGTRLLAVLDGDGQLAEALAAIWAATSAATSVTPGSLPSRYLVVISQAVAALT